MNQIIVSHPTGNQNVRAILNDFSKRNLLFGFNTTLNIEVNSLLIKLLPARLKDELLRRSFDLPKNQISTFPLRESIRIINSKIKINYLSKHEKGWASIDRIYHDFDYKVSRQLITLKNEQINAVYSYEDGALHTFQKAKSLNLKCIYDLPIAYWETLRTLIYEEKERMPQWSKTLAGGIKDSDQKLERKAKELDLADIVICPSQFVANSLPNWSKKKRIICSHFGSPSSYTDQKKFLVNTPLRVLFVGSMSQRKGLGDLLAAMKLINSSHIQLVILGNLQAPMEFYRKEFPDFQYEKGRPHKDVLKLMQTCDVFCLPSIVEGRALVMQEALSQGLPLIITPNTGGEDLILEGKTGFLIPIRSPEKIAEKLIWFIENRNALPYMSIQSKLHSAKYTWESYAEKISLEADQ